MKAIFELTELSLQYGKKPVVVNMNAHFLERRITCLVGASGVGKSTLLRTLNRMNDLIPSFRCSGRVAFQGIDIYRDTHDVNLLRRKVGMVFQEPCIFPASIYDNVIFGLRHFNLKKRHEYPMVVEKILTSVFLWEEVKDRLHKSARELSHGQQQRLSIARALVVEPEVLLLDEPTSSLDYRSSGILEELFERLKGELTIILATHKLEQVKRIADDVIAMK